MPEPEASRERILRFAADYASQHGLNDLSIGKLAKATGMSKAGLHGPFGSKTALQLATIHFAQGIFTQAVILPARAQPAGAARAKAFSEAWLQYVDDRVFPGGCFFGRVSMEGDSLPEAVNAEIRRLFALFRRFMGNEVGKSRKLRRSDAAAAFADQVLALVVSYNWAVNSVANPTLAANIRALIHEKFSEIV